MIGIKTTILLFSASLLLPGCADYVTREEFNVAVTDLRSEDGDLQAQITSFKDQFGEMTDQLHNKFQGYDATIAQFQGRLRVDMTAHFGFGEAVLRERDKPALDEFTSVVRNHQANIVVTVEGFTDPAGDAKYNEWLGMERAKAVREYLIASGGLSAEQVRAVSYGEDSDRLIAANAWGVDGAANRRVALVIDYVAGN